MFCECSPSSVESGKSVMNRLLASAAVAASLAFASAAGAAEVYDQPLTTPTEDGQEFAGPPAIDGLENLYRAASALPAPMTWVMMIIGFGSAGAILRRRKALGEFD